MKKMPYGILCGTCLIIAFYSAIAFFGVHFVLQAVANQTSETVSMFDSWWQILLFIVFVITSIGFVLFLIFYFLQKRKLRKEDNNEQVA